jgi:O-antigen/teichoic acid export membrane protein
MRGARFALWRDRSLRFAMGAGATLVSGLVGILRNKWFAQHLDVSGIGVLAQVTSSQAWLGMAGSLGLGLPIARVVGAATASDDTATMRRSLWAALSLLAISVSAAIVLGLLLAEPISRALLGAPQYAGLIRISLVGVAGVALQQVLAGLFAGRSDVKAPLAFSIAGGTISILAMLLLVPRAGVWGAVLAASLLFPAGCVGALLLRRKDYGPLLTPPRERALEPGIARGLLKVGGAALVSALVELGTLLAIRAHYVRTHGIEANGLLQSGLAIAQQVGALFYAYMTSYAFGKISGASGVSGAAGVRDYTRKHWTPILVVAAGALGLTSLAAGPLLRLLYSHRFDPAQPLMAWAVVGEFGRIALVMWALGSLPLGGARLWFPVSLLFPAVLAVAYTGLVLAGAGPASMPKAYALAGVIGALLVGAVMSRRGVTLGIRELSVFAGGAAVLVLLAMR